MQDSDTVLPVEAEKEWIEAPGGWGGGEDLTSTSTSTSMSIPSSSSSPKEEKDDDESSPFDLFANVDKSLKFPFDVLTTTTKKKVISNKKRLYLSGYKLDSDETAQSTGVTLWDAAPRLANYLMNHDNKQEEEENKNDNRNMTMKFIIGKRVLELGSGLGLCGIVAYHIGAKYVMMTDADTITLEKMRFNVTQNCCSPTCTSTSTDTTDTDTSDSTATDNDTSCGESGIATSSSSSSIDCKQLIWNEQLQCHIASIPLHLLLNIFIFVCRLASLCAIRHSLINLCATSIEIFRYSISL